MQNADVLEAEIFTAGCFTEMEGAASSNERDIQYMYLKASQEEVDRRQVQSELPRPIPRNSVESDYDLL